MKRCVLHNGCPHYQPMMPTPVETPEPELGYLKFGALIGERQPNGDIVWMVPNTRIAPAITPSWLQTNKPWWE